MINLLYKVQIQIMMYSLVDNHKDLTRAYFTEADDFVSIGLLNALTQHRFDQNVNKNSAQRITIGTVRDVNSVN